MDEERATVAGSPISGQEISERLLLIESMMREGRKTTEYWGWSFLLWGIAYLIAVAWSNLLHSAGGRALPWPLTMIFAALLTVGIARRRTRNRPRTDKSRATHAIWMAMGCGIFVFALPVAYSGHLQSQSFMAAIEVMLGIANVGSGIFLKWRVQITVGVLWWMAAIASCFVSDNGVAYVFLAATFVCMIGFGIYLMIRESRDKARARASEIQHA